MAHRRKRKWCKVCQQHTSVVGHISARGKCTECGNARLEANNAAMRRHTGPFYEHWRRRTLAAFGIVVPLDSDRDAA